MNRLLGTLAALCLSTAAGTSWAGCCVADPSARDLRPEAPPLLVRHLPATAELLLEWEPTRSGARVWQGDLDRLWLESALNDQALVDIAEPRATVPRPEGNAYYLVSATCDGLHCTRGRDRFGDERPTPGCEILERGAIRQDVAICLGTDQGVIRDQPEYDAFAACFPPGEAPPPPGLDDAIVWATDFSNAACGTCLEFPCAQRTGDQLIVERRGQPWGDCDAIHFGGAWARVPAAPTIIILEEMPPFPLYGSCR